MRIVVLVALAFAAGACAPGDEAPSAASEVVTTTSAAPSADTAPGSVPTTTTTTPPAPAAPDGRRYPSIAASAAEAADRLGEVEALVHTADPAEATWPDLAHEQQMLYRTIGRNPDWIPEVLAAMPEEYAAVAATHLAARRAIAGIGHGDPPVDVPAWEIIEPLPARELRRLYEEAEAATGIEWTFLAAINLVETGFGRIDGLSTAGAQGPMQFLPSTWAEVSDGDIDDPYDAIPAAARYLVQRGAPADMHAGLWGYNNSNEYVAAITHYATLFRDDPRSFLATHSWEIHYSSAIGDLWFPVGYRRDAPMPATEHVADAPWSAPPEPD